jgi:hypothetical protein
MLGTGRYQVQIPARESDFFFLQNFQTRSGADPASYSLGAGLLPGKNWPGLEVNHSSVTITEVKNNWRYICTPIYACMAWREK